MLSTITLRYAQILVRFRKWYWSALFAKFGEHSRVLGRIIVHGPGNVRVGTDSVLNEGVLINARANVDIGDHVHLSYRVMIITTGLDYLKAREDRTHILAPVVIEDGVWVGAGAIINPGVTIGKDSVIGSGSVVVDNIPPRSVAVGAPATVVKTF